MCVFCLFVCFIFVQFVIASVIFDLSLWTSLISIREPTLKHRLLVEKPQSCKLHKCIIASLPSYHVVMPIWNPTFVRNEWCELCYVRHFDHHRCCIIPNTTNLSKGPVHVPLTHVILIFLQTTSFCISHEFFFGKWVIVIIKCDQELLLLRLFLLKFLNSDLIFLLSTSLKYENIHEMKSRGRCQAYSTLKALYSTLCVVKG